MSAIRRRRMSYISVDFHQNERPDGSKYDPQIIFTASSSHGSISSVYTQRKVLNRKDTRLACYSYWSSVWPLMLKISQTKEIESIENIITKLQSFASALVSRLFDDQSIEVLWNLARECEILRIDSNLLEVPWEALVNPREGSGLFLSDMCLVRRGYLTQDSFGRGHLRDVALTGDYGVYIDNVLKNELLNAKSQASRHLDCVLRRNSTFLSKSISRTLEDMSKNHLVLWICENSYTNDEGDKLRLADDVFVTGDVIRGAKRINSKLVFLITCGEQRVDRSHAPIGAVIAATTGATVVSLLLPVHVEVGLMMLRLVDFYASQCRGRCSDRTLFELLNRIRYRAQQPRRTALSTMTLFVGVYGDPDVGLCNGSAANRHS